MSLNSTVCPEQYFKDKGEGNILV